MTLRSSKKLSRREFARLSAAAAAVTAGYSPLLAASGDAAARPLTQFGYGDVTVDSTLHQAQLQNTHEVAQRRWEASVAGTAVTLLPYVAIDAEEYSTFLTLAG
jgi:hypothetical protein